MSSINSIGGNNPVNRIVPRNTPQTAATEPAKPARGADKLELSGVGQFLQTLKAGGDVRADKVAQIKAQIESGTYEDDHKLDVAVDRLLEDLNK